MGVLVSQDQDPNIYDPDGLIEFGQTYYWRIDEVNDAHPDKLWKGEVWSFTAEPFAYPLENITATASSNEPGQEPADALTLEGDLHPTDLTQMWLSGQSEPAVAWINFEFDKVYKLHNMWVWNYNGALLNVVYGIKDASIDYLFNGTDYMPLGIYEFARATGANDYAHDDYSSNPSGNNEIDLSDVIATDIRITANSNWSSGLVDQYGLSEVRIFYVPVRARESQPASGQAGVALDAVLSWRVGREAVSHEVYFSSDMQAVIDGTALIDTVSQSSYALGPPGLELGKTYYWKVNEVNEAEIPASWEGEVWSFNAQEYLVVEDFEQYDDVCNRVFYTWVDGFGHSGYSDCGVEPYDGNVTGSTVGNLNAPFAERSIVNSGRQSMPLEYNNSAQPYYSETQRQWAVAQDLTRGGANSLTVWFYGDSGNTAEVLYVAVEDSAGNITVVSHTQPEAVQAANWQEWNIQLTDFAGVDPSSVKKIYIGVGNRAAPQSGGAGKLYIDDIRLYP
jgi:hypothetical protein